ncbi:kinase-like domain-containing protein [Rhizophagus irregularis DAOM 181602=DAOM 197198]|nr:kinase-like domain-containing protein [Rhizophagus irregularis DAOM 181602=DAOM 197198]
MEKKLKDLWNVVNVSEYQFHVTISTIDSTTESEDTDERIVYMEDLEKRKQAYGICGECNEPGQRPKISKDIPKLLADLIMKCWDAEIESRPTAKELYQKLTKWNKLKYYRNTEIGSQVRECDKIGKKKFESRSSKDKSKNIQTHPQAIYTSRLFNFKNLPKPVNSSDLSSFQFNSVYTNYAIQPILANPISECLDVQLSELELNEICQDGENSVE